MVKTNKHKSAKRKETKRVKKVVKLAIKKPPFSSPGSSTTTVKKEKSIKLPDNVRYEILANPNMILFWVEKPNGEAACMQPLSALLESNTKQAINFRECTNIKAPLLTRRTSRADHRPMLSKHPANVKRGQINYPFRCLLGIKTDDIDAHDYVNYVMNSMKDIINAKSNYPNKYMIDLHASDVTPSCRRSLDSVITDKSVQTVLYRYYFSSYLTDDNFDDETSTCEIAQHITQTFLTKNPTLAPYFFTSHEGKYSFLATRFGYKNQELQSAKTKRSKRDISCDTASKKPFFQEDTDNDSDDAGEDIQDSDTDRSDDTSSTHTTGSASFIDDSSTVSGGDSSSTVSV